MGFRNLRIKIPDAYCASGLHHQQAPAAGCRDQCHQSDTVFAGRFTVEFKPGITIDIEA